MAENWKTTWFVVCECGYKAQVDTRLRTCLAEKIGGGIESLSVGEFRRAKVMLRCTNCHKKNPRLVMKPAVKKSVTYVATRAVDTSQRERIFHKSTCGWMRHVSYDKVIEFTDRASATAKGYRPCTTCRP